MPEVRATRERRQRRGLRALPAGHPQPGPARRRCQPAPRQAAGQPGLRLVALSKPCAGSSTHMQPSAARAHRRRGLGKRQPAGPAVPVMPASRRSPALDRAHASPRALCHRLPDCPAPTPRASAAATGWCRCSLPPASCRDWRCGVGRRGQRSAPPWCCLRRFCRWRWQPALWCAWREASSSTPTPRWCCSLVAWPAALREGRTSPAGPRCSWLGQQRQRLGAALPGLSASCPCVGGSTGGGGSCKPVAAATAAAALLRSPRS